MDEMNAYEDAIWMADVYDIFSIDIELDGVKRTIRAWAGKWNTYYDFTGEPEDVRREKLAVRKALMEEIERRRTTGQKPDYSDREA